MLIRKIKSHLLLLVFSLILVILLLPFYKDGKMISGGEGAYFIDFPLMLINYGYSWLNWGTGIFATSLNFGYVFHLILLQILFSNERVVNFVMIYSLYFLPFLATYLLSLELKLKPQIALLIAIFYITNPFISNFMKSINQWNMLAAYILPAFFLIILKFWNSNWKLFFIFGLHSLFFAFTNANPPTMVLYQIAIIFFVLLISLYKEQKINFKSIIKNYSVVISSFLLFNFWWIINWFYILPSVGQGYTKEFAISWLRGSGQFVPVFWQGLSLTGLLPYPSLPEYDFFSRHYSHFFVPLLLPIPMLIIIYFLFKKRLSAKYHLVLSLMLLGIGFLSNGTQGTFGGVYIFLIKYLPFFSIFKSAGEKWGVLYVFLLTLFLIFIFRRLRPGKDKYYFFATIPLLIYTLYCVVPFITGNFLPDYKRNEQVIGSKRFIDKIEYQNLRKELNNDPLQYRVLSLPGSLNYQVALRIDGNRFYTGNDPVLSNTNKSFIAPYNGTFSQTFPVLFDSISNPKYLNLLGLFNIKKIVINKDMYPWFGFQEKENIPQIEEILDKNLTSSKNKVIDLYDIGDFYLPRIYIPQKIIYSTESIESLMDIVSFENYDIRSAIFLADNTDKKDAENTDKAWRTLIDRADEVFVKGELKDKIMEEELGAPLFSKEPLPYIRQKPGSLIYPLVLKKEGYDKWKVRKEPEKLFKKHLFYAGKRVAEYLKYADNADEERIMRMVERYKKEMVDAWGILENLKQQDDKNFINDWDKYEKTLLSHRAKIEETGGLKEWKNVFVELEKKVDDLKIKYDFSKLVYEIDILKSGEYEVLIDNADMTADNADINTENTDMEAENADTDRWVNLGKKYFEKGVQELTLPIKGISENLVDENLKIRDYSPDSLYRISFDYKAVRGGSFFVAEGKTGKTVETQLSSTGDEFKHFEMFFRSSADVQEAAVHLSISVNEEKNLRIEKIYQPEIMLRMKTDNADKDADNTEKTLRTRITPKITFVKINPTKYRIKVENAKVPYTLVFSESFHKGWRLYIAENADVSADNAKYGNTVASYFNGEIKEGTHKNVFLDKNTFETWGKKTISEDKHLLVNGYANSWYIEPARICADKGACTENADGSYDMELVVEFAPQRLFYIGLFISLITLIGCIAYLVISRITRMKKRGEH